MENLDELIIWSFEVYHHMGAETRIRLLLTYSSEIVHVIYRKTIVIQIFQQCTDFYDSVLKVVTMVSDHYCGVWPQS